MRVDAPKGRPSMAWFMRPVTLAVKITYSVSLRVFH